MDDETCSHGGYRCPAVESLKERNALEVKRIDQVMEEREKRYSQRFDAQEQAVKSALTAAETAKAKYEAYSDVRFANTNEWRGTVTELIAAMQGRSSGLNAGWGYLIGAAGIGGAVLTVLLH